MTFHLRIIGAAVCALTCLAPQLAAAQDAAPSPPPETPSSADYGRISAQDWRKIALGRTVIYTFQGEFFGAESYNPDGSTVYWRNSDGACKEGLWSNWRVGGGPIFCFDWPVNGASCWAHLRVEDGMQAILVDEQGRLQRDGSNVFGIGGVKDGWTPCEPEGMS